MLGRWQSGRKIDIAKQLLTNITDSLKDVKNLELGLRVYGHQRSFPPQDCDDTRLEINFIPSNVFADRLKWEDEVGSFAFSCSSDEFCSSSSSSSFL